MGQWQGFAKGNILNLNRFGEGAIATDKDADDIKGTQVFNDTPDTKTCTLYEGGILACSTVLTEYCSKASLEDFTAPFCKDREGKWLNTYSVTSIATLDGADCPSPPPGYCDSNPFPDKHPLDPNNPNKPPNPIRRLSDPDDEEESHHPSCPVLAGQMDGRLLL